MHNINNVVDLYYFAKDDVLAILNLNDGIYFYKSEHILDMKIILLNPYKFGSGLEYLSHFFVICRNGYESWIKEFIIDYKSNYYIDLNTYISKD